MKSASPLVHGLWLVALLLAFAIGKWSASNGKPNGGAAPAGPAADSSSGAGVSAIGSSSAGRPDRSIAGSSTLGAQKLPASEFNKLLPIAISQKDPVLRRQQIATLLANLTAENLPAVLEAFEKGPRGDNYDREFRDFLYAWGRLDGSAAVAYAMNSESPRRDHYGGGAAISGWATADPDGAKGYVQAMDAGHGKEWMHFGVFQSVIASNLADATDWSRTNTRSIARGRSMDMLAAAYLEQQGSSGVFGWLNSIDHTGDNEMLAYKTHAARTGLLQIASAEPEQAREWLEANASQPWIGDDTLTTVARRLHPNAYGESIEWVASLPENKARRESMAHLVDNWAEHDAAAAGTWLSQNQDLPDYDHAAGRYAMEIAGDDPLAAISWSNTIDGPERRDKVLQRVFQSWQRRDPAAAAAWLEGQ